MIKLKNKKNYKQKIFCIPVMFFKYRFLLAIFLVFCFVGSPKNLWASSFTNKIVEAFRSFMPKISDEEKARYQTIQSLNYVVVALTHIITYNDRVVLDQEYDIIINNLNLRAIPDEEIIILLQDLLDLLTRSKISDREREFIEERYERNINNALKNAVRSGISGIQFTPNMYATLASGIMSAGSVYFNYRDQIDQFRIERKGQEWEIEKDTLLRLNDFRRNLLRSSWRLLKEYDIPDNWRLTESQLSNYSDILRDPDIRRRHSRLTRIENDFQMYPPYWYYRGRAAQVISNHADAYKSFDYFNNKRMAIYRKDPFAASVAMCLIMLEMDNASIEKTLSNLKLLVDNSSDKDWANLLFAALKYAQIGRIENARELITRNLENGHSSTFGSSETIDVLLPSLLENNNPDEFKRMMDNVIMANTVSNYDMLRLYGKMQNKDILRHINAEFQNMLLIAVPYTSRIPGRHIFNKDGIALYIPARWVADNLDAEIQLRVPEAKVEKKLADDIRQEHNSYQLIFNELIDINKLINDKKQMEVFIHLARDKLLRDRTQQSQYDITLHFVSDILTSEQAKSWFEKLSVKDILLPEIFVFQQLKKYFVSSKKEDELKYNFTLIFRKKAIIIDGEKFEWSDDGVLIL